MSPFDADAVAREAVARAGATPDPKRPLFRPLPPAPAFPMHALGALREPVEAICSAAIWMGVSVDLDGVCDHAWDP